MHTSDRRTCLVPLPTAAQRLRISWKQAWRRVLIGELRGVQKDGKWYVDEAQLPPAQDTTDG